MVKQLAVVLAVVIAACGGDDGTATTSNPGSVASGSSAESAETTVGSAAGDGCADVVAVEVTGSGPYSFAVTVSSADTGEEKYADEWRIESSDGDVIGVRELTHPHVNEQPFTRSLNDVDVEEGAMVVVAAGDSVAGYCGATMEVTVGP